MITRKVRENRMRMAESEYMNLTEDLLNGEVIDMAIHLYGVLSTVSSKYTNDAIVDLIPEVSSILNRLDASIKINSDLTEQLFEINEENNILKKKIEEEKTKLNANLEESLCMEEMIEAELVKLKTENLNMKEEQEALKEEIKNSTNLVSALISDCEKLTQELHICKEKIHQHRKKTEHISGFTTPKKLVKQREKTGYVLETANQYSVLANEDVPLKLTNKNCQIQTKVQVHRSASFSPSTVNKIKSVVNQQRGRKDKILVLSDSQGRNLHSYIQKFTEDYEVCVHSKPGAKLKDIVRDSKCLIEDCSTNDFVVLIGGTNDIGKCEPSQFSITQGLKSLLALNVNTNVIINSVPYRYDTSQFNDNIFYANMVITRLIREYKGPLKLSLGELNTILHRHHFTRHGLHINKAGKRLLGKSIFHTISSRRTLLPGAVDDNWRGPCRNQEGSVCKQGTVSRARNVDSDLSLIEPYPSPGMSSSASAAQPARASRKTSDSDDCIQITSLKDFPPLPLSSDLCNISTEAHTSDLPTFKNQSPVFLDKIIQKI